MGEEGTKGTKGRGCTIGAPGGDWEREGKEAERGQQQKSQDQKAKGRPQGGQSKCF